MKAIIFFALWFSASGLTIQEAEVVIPLVYCKQSSYSQAYEVEDFGTIWQER